MSDPVIEPVVGRARVGRRTKDLTKRLEFGDIAIIDHADVDRVAADGLIARRVKAIVNCSASITGRYPNLGPRMILDAGIALVDGVGHEAMDRILDGTTVTIDRNRVLVDGVEVARGCRHDTNSIATLLDESRLQIGSELKRFAANTLGYMESEQFLLLDEPHVPELVVEVRGRHVLVVVRGDQFKEDLTALRGYVRDLSPVIFAVDGGADAVLQAGMKPDVIIGDFDSVSSSTLRCGAQLIAHAYPNGQAPGAERLAAEGLAFSTFALAGTSEDIAMLLAYEKGAELIVAVGTHVSLVDFLDKGRPGMASTFLTRLKVGPILVDAKGVNKLYEPRIRKRDLTLLVGAATVALIITMATLPIFRLFWASLWLLLRETMR
jgi:uncharacterized membrane-anchored protein